MLTLPQLQRFMTMQMYKVNRQDKTGQFLDRHEYQTFCSHNKIVRLQSSRLMLSWKLCNVVRVPSQKKQAPL